MTESTNESAETRHFKRAPILQFFAYEHLPPLLQAVSKPFGDLARDMDRLLPSNAEKYTALRKILEAKDAAVRAVLFRGNFDQPTKQGE